jgi:hypothetical protein
MGGASQHPRPPPDARFQEQVDAPRHGDHLVVAGGGVSELDPGVSCRICGPCCSTQGRMRNVRHAATQMDGCGNVGPVEITERFPPDLGNLVSTREISTFHTADSRFNRKNEANIAGRCGCAPSWGVPEHAGSSATSRNEERRGCWFVSWPAITNHTFLIETLPSVHASSTAIPPGGTT